MIFHFALPLSRVVFARSRADMQETKKTADFIQNQPFLLKTVTNFDTKANPLL